MTTINKLLSIEEAEMLSQKFSAEDTKAHYKQLADTMRELQKKEAVIELMNATLAVAGDTTKLALSRTQDLIRENEELKKYPLKMICEKCNVLTEVASSKHTDQKLYVWGPISTTTLDPKTGELVHTEEHPPQSSKT